MARQKRKPKLRTYRVTFWRDDGRWRDGYYVRPHIEIFTAYTDEEVVRKARSYVAKNRHGWKALYINKIVEIVRPEITRTTSFVINYFDTRI